jgi:hypothetical protein
MWKEGAGERELEANFVLERHFQYCTASFNLVFEVNLSITNNIATTQTYRQI